MVKRHLKRLNTPKTWAVKRKVEKFLTRPFPSGHSYLYSLSLNQLLKSLKIAKTTREVKYIVNNKQVLVDQHKRSDEKSPVGFMDVVSFPDTDQHFRVTLNSVRKLVGIAIDKKEASKKICKVSGKKMHNGKIQLALHDGRTLLLDKTDVKVGDSIIIELPSQKIVSRIPFEKGTKVIFVKGRFLGKTGVVDTIDAEKVHVTVDDTKIETLKGFAFPISKDEKEKLTVTA
jgi:small subunit ribosomal protein S4e